MRAKGINYDTGFLSAGTSTHEPFDPERVRAEMRVIRDDLHCTAVRITGGDPARLEIASNHAADAGLEVWLCPFTNGLTQDELLALLADCADRAERLRRGGAEVVLLTGSELSLFTVGFLPGDTLAERLALVGDPLRLRPLIAELRAGINAFLGRAVAVVRARFGGRVSYASILPLEGVDWKPFDVIATDAAYRTSRTAPTYRESIRAFVEQGRAQGKPVAITEFGCATFRGAGGVGGTGDALIEWGDDGRASRLKTECARDEGEQVAYLRELLDVFDGEGVDAAFLYTFARYDLLHRDDPYLDLDRASAGVVKVLDGKSRALDAADRRYPEMPWEPWRSRRSPSGSCSCRRRQHPRGGHDAARGRDRGLYLPRAWPCPPPTSGSS